jgi:hypothetical protein
MIIDDYSIDDLINSFNGSEIEDDKRYKLVRFLSRATEILHLNKRTLHLALDIFNDVETKIGSIPVSQYKLFGAASLFIAIKFEEVETVTSYDMILYLKLDKWSRRDLINAEEIILKKINFKLVRDLNPDIDLYEKYGREML